MSNTAQETDVNAKLQTFIDTITESTTYQEFVEASEQLDEDAEAQALLAEYRQKQQQMQRNFDQSIMSELQELQTEMSDNETIQHHQAAQEALIELLNETNDVISEQIGREFAQSTGGGCC